MKGSSAWTAAVSGSRLRGSKTMRKTKKIVATALSAAMAASMCVAVPATAAFAADGQGGASADATAPSELKNLDEFISSWNLGDQFYNDGAEVRPYDSIAPKRTADKVKLTAGKDYNVVYTNNKEVGTATATLTGIESAGYTGTKTFTFNIVKFSFDVSYNGKQLGSLDRAAVDKAMKDASDNNKDVAYQFGTTVVYVPAKQYLTFNTLMRNVDVASWVTVSATATDTFGSTVTTQVNTEGKFFPAQTKDAYSADGAYNVPAIIANSYSTAEITSSAADALATAKENYAAGKKTDGDNRLFSGALESEYAQGNIPGNRFASDVCRFDILDGYAAMKANPVKVAKTKATVAKGKSVAVKVSKAQGKVTVSTSAKKVAKVSYSKKTGRVTIKGLKKGKATVTVKAAGNSAYKAGSKTIKVTVK